MAYEFHETFDVVIPDVEEQLGLFSESEFNKDKGLIIEMAAIHEGATANFNYYAADELEKAVSSWVSPYPKPVIKNHDLMEEPIGRVIGAMMATEDDGTSYTRLQIAVLDPEAIQKVADGRYLTGSVGGRATEAVCSICQTDWAASESRIPCKHQRGKVYNGKVAMLEMRGVGFKEYSFVNAPADSRSSVRKPKEEEDTSWVKPTKFFVLDMNKEKISECREHDTRNALESLSRKEAAPIYMGLKGAFLSALAVHEAEKEELLIDKSVNANMVDTNTVETDNSTEENVMSKDAPEVQDDDILAVTEGLSADLAAVKEETADDDDVNDDALKPETNEPIVEPEVDKDSADEADNEDQKDVEEGERAEGQEKPHSKDVDPETSEGAPVSREADDDKEGKGPVGVEPGSEPSSADDDAEGNDEGKESTDLNAEEDKKGTEPAESELEARIETLENENSRLRAALHRTLVERVVDAKIAVGLVEADKRGEAIEEHAGRTASSLADTLKDVATMPRVSSQNASGTPVITEESEVVGNENNATTMEEELSNVEEEEDPKAVAEMFFTDVLMGRKKA